MTNPHQEKIEVHYTKIKEVGRLRGRDAVCLDFEGKLVWILFSHLAFSYHDKEDKYKVTVMLQQWIVKANELDKFIYVKEPTK